MSSNLQISSRGNASIAFGAKNIRPKSKFLKALYNRNYYSSSPIRPGGTVQASPFLKSVAEWIKTSKISKSISNSLKNLKYLFIDK